MVNPFVKYKGFEFFGTYEQVKGRMNFEPGTTERNFTQLAAELICRLLPEEQAYIAARYNTVKGRQLFQTQDITINRLTFSAGWFPTRNILLKVEYVNQEYLDFTPFDFQYEGKFKGASVQAVVGF